MSDYDNTNSGALFPAEHMKVIRQGRIDIEGTEDNYALIQTETPNGHTIFEVYQRVGAVFANSDKKSEKAPDMSGNITDKASGEWRMAGWKKISKAGDPFTSIAMERPREMPKPTSPQESATPAQAGSDADPTPPVPPVYDDDNIPF